MKLTAVGMIVPEYPPHSTGGGGIAYRAIAHALAERGHRVEILTGDYTGAEGFAQDGSIVVERMALLALPSIPHGYGPPRRPRRLERAAIALSGRTGVVHVHGIGLPFCDIAARALRRSGVPYVLTNHGYPHAPSRAGALTKRLFNLYERALIRPNLHAAAALSAISAFCACDGPLDEVAPVVIPNGVAGVPALREPLGGRKTSNLLFAGRLQRDKGVDILLAALADHPALDLDILGPDAGERTALEHRSHALGLAHRVRFRGALAHEETLRAMQGAYAVVLPSLNEPYGLVGLEAMAAGALLVCSDRGGHRSYANERNALVFKTGDAHDLSRILGSFPLERTAYDVLRNNARETAHAHTWATVADSYARLYPDVAAT